MKRTRKVSDNIPNKRPKQAEMKLIKLASWNVCGLRAMLSKDGINRLIDSEAPNIICLNETMLQEKNIEQVEKLIPSNFNKYWNCSRAKKGYSGVAIFTETKPERVIYGLGTERHDIEGRALTAEFKDFYVLSTYVPNGGRNMLYRTQHWDIAIREYIIKLQETKPVIWCGDMNVVHEDIDIYDIRGKETWACLTPEERGNFHTTLEVANLVDSFRYMHPGVKSWSYFSRRNVGAQEKGQGWRLDYIIVSQSLKRNIDKAYIRPDILGSDHHPCILHLLI